VIVWRHQWIITLGEPASEAHERVARERLLLLEEQFTEAAAASVLRETLGLDSFLAPSSSYAPGKKRQRQM
jgi:hypothetical protein